MSGERTERSAERRTASRDGGSSRIDRREFVRTAVGGGFALGVASALGVDDFLGTDGGEVSVVTALVRTDPDDPFSLEERTRTVPGEWYAAVSKALEVNDLLSQVGFTGYLGSAVVPGSYDSESASVSVGISTEGSSIPEMVEEVADGISINTETIVDVEDFEEGSELAEPRLASSIDGGLAPSGVACETPSSLATLGPALYDPADRRRFFSTAAHAFDGIENPVGEPARLPLESGDPLELGPVERTHPVEDVAAIEPSGRLDPASRIGAPIPVRIRGQLTRWGLADLVARGERLEKVGALTGQTTGRIQGIDAVTCFTETFCRRGQIRWGGEMDLTDGDSGSVSYYRDPIDRDGDVLIAGFNNARTWWPGQSYVWGVSAYALTDEYGYHF